VGLYGLKILTKTNPTVRRYINNPDKPVAITGPMSAVPKDRYDKHIHYFNSMFFNKLVQKCKTLGRWDGT
jgi:hypothetical protein